MAIVSEQQVVESTDHFGGDQIIVATLPGAATIGNAVVVITFPEVTGRTVTNLTGAAASFTLLETNFASAHAAIATATTAAQTITLDEETDFSADVAFVNELSGIADPLDESGTSTTVTNGTNVTDHDLGTITPDGTDTVYYAAIVFSGSPGTVSNGTGTDLADWTEINVIEPNLKLYRRIVNGSSAAVTFRVTSSSARRSNGLFFALNGAAAGGGGQAHPLSGKFGLFLAGKL
jgi:hypothetical protein